MIVFITKVISVTLNSSYTIYGSAKKLTDLSSLSFLHPYLFHFYSCCLFEEVSQLKRAFRGRILL